MKKIAVYCSIGTGDEDIGPWNPVALFDDRDLAIKFIEFLKYQEETRGAEYRMAWIDEF